MIGLLRRRLQFSLGAMLLVLTAVSVFCAFMARERSKAAAEQRILKEFAAKEIPYTWRTEAPRWATRTLPAWLSASFERVVDFQVVQQSLDANSGTWHFAQSFDDTDCDRLAAFDKLSVLGLVGTSLKRPHNDLFLSLVHLEYVDLRNTGHSIPKRLLANGDVEGQGSKVPHRFSP